MKSKSTILEYTFTLIIPCIINIFIALYCFNAINSIAKEFAQVSHYEELAIKAENGAFENNQQKLSDLFRSLAHIDTGTSNGFELLSLAFIFWIFFFIITTSFQIGFFLKLKNKYAQKNKNKST
jgi:6-phosphogluconate dehydrogenase (decarboxylating)